MPSPSRNARDGEAATKPSEHDDRRFCSGRPLFWAGSSGSSRTPIRITNRLLLIPERLSGFKGVRDAFLGFAFAAEGYEGFALEIEEILFADELS
jgi:hypothetical protein